MKKSDFPHKSIGHRLKLIRGRKSQQDFSRMIGIHLRTYQRYESGERLPPFDIVSKISKICHGNLTWIITGGEDKEQQFKTDDLGQVINKLDYIFQYGSHPFIDFINQVLDIALISIRGNLEIDFPFHKDPPDDLPAFLISLIGISGKALQDILISEGKTVTAQIRVSKIKKSKEHSKT